MILPPNQQEWKKHQAHLPEPRLQQAVIPDLLLLQAGELLPLQQGTTAEGTLVLFF